MEKLNRNENKQKNKKINLTKQGHEIALNILRLKFKMHEAFFHELLSSSTLFFNNYTTTHFYFARP